MGFLTTCDRVKKLVGHHPCEHARSHEIKSHGYHFGGAWIVRSGAFLQHVNRVREILSYVRRLNGRFAPTTATVDALIDSTYWRVFAHDPALALVDVSVPSNNAFPDMATRYGNQPYDPSWRSE